MSDDNLLTRDEVAEMLGDSVRSLAIHRANGLPYVKLSAKKFRYRRKDVQRWIDEKAHRHSY